MEMRPLTLLPAMVLAVLLIGGPVLGHDSASADRIEGVWNVEVTILSACGPTGVPVATVPALNMFSHGGLLTEAPGTTLAPPPPILRGSPGLGTWQHLGGRHYTAGFTFFRLNPDNTFAGTQRITENIELSDDADSFTSTGTSDIFDTNGTLIREGCNSESSDPHSIARGSDSIHDTAPLLAGPGLTWPLNTVGPRCHRGQADDPIPG